MESLVESIRNNGVKIPLRGYIKDKRFYLIDGHRRKKACDILNVDDVSLLVPFIVEPTDRKEEDRIADLLICNDGKKLNPCVQNISLKPE
jgi:ParB-like chromosome segregation protein Spo0J